MNWIDVCHLRIFRKDQELRLVCSEESTAMPENESPGTGPPLDGLCGACPQSLFAGRLTQTVQAAGFTGGMEDSVGMRANKPLQLQYDCFDPLLRSTAVAADPQYNHEVDTSLETIHAWRRTACTTHIVVLVGAEKCDNARHGAKT